MRFNFEIREFSAQARHPRTGNPLFDNDGKPVPLWPHYKSVYWDGIEQGHLIPNEQGYRLRIINYRMPRAVREAMEQFVLETFGPVYNVTQRIPPLEIRRPDLIDEEEDE